MDKKIIMLTGGSISSVFMYNGINQEFSISKVVVEGKVSRRIFIGRRIKRLGLLKVLGQVIFQLTIPNILKIVSKDRLTEIEKIYSLNNFPIPQSIIKEVESVNSKECIKLLQTENPDFIIVNGTRIISKEVLNCVNAPFVNTHLGITPKYRGVHGGYWSLVNRDQENCGVTVHLVDSGIDTGTVLYQQNIYPTTNDNFVTYTYLQIGEGINLMKKVLSDFFIDELNEKVTQAKESTLWYHPTFLFYLKQWILRGIK